MKKFDVPTYLLFALILIMVMFESLAVIMSSYMFFVCLNDEQGSAFLNIALLLAVIHVLIMVAILILRLISIIKEIRREKHDQCRMD